MMLRNAMIGAYILTFVMESHFAIAKDPSGGKLSFCEFGPKAKVVASKTVKKFGKNKEKSRGSSKCVGTAKVQAFQWKCGTLNEVGQLSLKYLKNLVSEARDRCEVHCEERGKGCKGVLTVPSKCGLKVRPNDSAQYGKEFGCKKDCDGQSFIYCSLYDAAFETDNPALIARQRPNCHCYQH
jgi:hypothetical protein